MLARQGEIPLLDMGLVDAGYQNRGLNAVGVAQRMSGYGARLGWSAMGDVGTASLTLVSSPVSLDWRVTGTRDLIWLEAVGLWSGR